MASESLKKWYELFKEHYAAGNLGTLERIGDVIIVETPDSSERKETIIKLESIETQYQEEYKTKVAGIEEDEDDPNTSRATAAENAQILMQTKLKAIFKTITDYINKQKLLDE